MRDKEIKSGGKHCRNCGKVGHNARTCPEIKGKRQIMLKSVFEKSADEVEPYRPSPLSNNIILEDSQEMAGRDMIDTADEVQRKLDKLRRCFEVKQGGILDLDNWVT
ncbi:gag-pol polyprotein [Striga asiatica]|uniref:Gag-pol polyprotein n=1 Tax=Striga asiatica TaxID=4170 RepID=A0A5A7PF11_STRAF|nr:gag-pol polyprotein [Striga asiatica]